MLVKSFQYKHIYVSVKPRDPYSPILITWLSDISTLTMMMEHIIYMAVTIIMDVASVIQ
jgi:hypothetical protein